MLIEYSNSKSFSYKEYLSRVDVSSLIDIHLSKSIRESVGSLEEIFGGIHGGETPIVKLRGESSYSGYVFDVVSADLSDVWEHLDIANANLVNAFQSALLTGDEKSPAISNLLPAGRSHVEIQGEPDVEMAARLVRNRMFPEAVSALGQGELRGANVDRDRLLGVIRLGISGVPESVATLDPVEAEKHFLRAAENAAPVVASHCVISAARAAYVQGRLADAEAHLSRAITGAMAAEASYQMARLRLHAGDLASVESWLDKAFSLHWSFAMRAASDILFVVNSGPVVRVAQAVSKRILADEVAPDLERLTSQVRLLAEGELKRRPVQTQQSYENLRASTVRLAAGIDGGRLKFAHESRAELSLLHAAFVEVCSEYARSLIVMAPQPAANDVIMNGGAAAPNDGIRNRPGLLTAGIAGVGLLLTAVYLSPDLAAQLRQARFGIFELVEWLAKVLFVWFLIAVYAVPALWLLLVAITRRRQIKEDEGLLRTESNAEWVNADAAKAVDFVEEMARSYKKGHIEGPEHGGPKLDASAEAEQAELGNSMGPLARH